MLARFLSAALVLSAALPALAEDVPLPPLTPKGEYLVMTQDDATSTSKCIGSPVTPMCAVETMLACWSRAIDDLCRIAMAVGKNPDIGRGKPGPNMIYRVVRREVLNERTFPWPPKRDRSWRPGGLTMRSGDIRIDIIDKSCWDEISSAACDPVWSLVPTAFIVRQQNNRWTVITWGYAYDPRDWHR